MHDMYVNHAKSQCHSLQTTHHQTTHHQTTHHQTRLVKGHPSSSGTTRRLREPNRSLLLHATVASFAPAPLLISPAPPRVVLGRWKLFRYIEGKSCGFRVLRVHLSCEGRGTPAGSPAPPSRTRPPPLAVPWGSHGIIVGSGPAGDTIRRRTTHVSATKTPYVLLR